MNTQSTLEEQTRAANALVLAVEAKARQGFDLIIARGGLTDQAIASVPVTPGGPRIVARYRDEAPTVYEAFTRGSWLVVQFADRDACVEYVRGLMAVAS